MSALAMHVRIDFDRALSTLAAWVLAQFWLLPLAKPIVLAYGLVSVSHHWHNFIWPLIITNSLEARPLTVGLSICAVTDSGIQWSVTNAATPMTSGPPLIAFLLFQRHLDPRARNRF